MQDYAFSIPDFKQQLASPASAAQSPPRLIAAGSASPSSLEEEQEQLLRGLALTAGGGESKGPPSPPGQGQETLGSLEEWGRGLWEEAGAGGRGGDEEEEEEAEAVASAGGEEGEGGGDGNEPGQGAYRLGRKFEGGGHGEIWRAYKVKKGGKRVGVGWPDPSPIK